jgi:diguanylate cyclase (GGDEF)-like protein
MIAEDIRRRINALEIPTSDSSHISLSVSIGVGEYDFYPDFMRTLDIADRRLYLAKDAGKNRVQAKG